MKRTKIIILGAAGRDFHNFNTIFKDNKNYEVVAFTAAQIPNIDGRKYPPELSGKLYPKGIPIYSESELTKLIMTKGIEQAIFAYSDVSFNYVMSKASQVMAAGADFKLLSAQRTMLTGRVPVIAVVAVRTGSGKSQTSRKVCNILRSKGLHVVVVRHPMPYGDLARQKVQRFAQIEDLKRHNCTIEEMEEYEPHITNGDIVYAGVDYEAILRQAEKEGDVIVWDGGNNDTPFYKPDLTITVADPHRPGHELSYYAGMTNLLMANVVLINKIDSATKSNVELVKKNIKSVNPHATIIEAASPVSISSQENEKPENLIRGKRVLVVEDGPTLTHGEMPYGAGVIAAKKYGAKELVDPRPWTVRSIGNTFKKFPKIGALLPAMGYGEKQIKDLEATINRVQCDTVIIGTPIDLRRVVKINKPTVRVRYELEEKTKPDLENVIVKFISKHKIVRRNFK
ncbi:MAG: cyclic 2,3-diphosphoglycerate synthase [Candidatus Kryptoniota bacterium]